MLVCQINVKILEHQCRHIHLNIVFFLDSLNCMLMLRNAGLFFTDLQVRLMAEAACSSKEVPSKESSAEATDPASIFTSKPVCLIILGMAGSGKTTFVQV